MANYFLTNKALEDLSLIWDYTFETWSEFQADIYYRMLIETFKKIADDPDIGKGYAEIEPDVLGFKINKHIVFYRSTELKDVEILRILHEMMDLRNRIQE